MHSIIVKMFNSIVGNTLLLFITLDLPRLKTMLFNGNGVLRGSDEDNRRANINGHPSYMNTLIMKGKSILFNYLDLIVIMCRSSFTYPYELWYLQRQF